MYSIDMSVHKRPTLTHYIPQNEGARHVTVLWKKNYVYPTEQKARLDTDAYVGVNSAFAENLYPVEYIKTAVRY